MRVTGKAPDPLLNSVETLRQEIESGAWSDAMDSLHFLLRHVQERREHEQRVVIDFRQRVHR